MNEQGFKLYKTQKSTQIPYMQPKDSLFANDPLLKVFYSEHRSLPILKSGCLILSLFLIAIFKILTESN